MQAMLNTWGNSLGVRIPSTILKSMNLKSGDHLQIIEKSDEIILRRAPKKKKNLQERLKNFKGKYELKEVNFGGAVGNEAW